MPRYNVSDPDQRAAMLAQVRAEAKRAAADWLVDDEQRAELARLLAPAPTASPRKRRAPARRRAVVPGRAA